MNNFIKSNVLYPNILISFYRMNQPQPLYISLDFQGYHVCQIPADGLEVELKIKTKWGKFILHTDQFTRTEKYRAWRKPNRCKIHSRRRKHLSNSHLNISSDSSTFVNHGQGLGYPPNVFKDSDSDQKFPPHVQILENYCRTCLTEKVRCSYQPTSNWSGELIDTTQLAPPNTDTNQDRDDVQDNPLLSDWTDQDNFWSGKTYDQARAQLTQKPAPPNSPSKGDEDSEWSKHLHPHNYRAKAPSQVSPSKPPPGWPKSIRTNPTAQVICLPANPKTSNNVNLCITKITTSSKETFSTLD